MGMAGGLRIRRLVVPIDFSASSMEALEYGVQFAKQVGAAVAIVHTLEPVAYGLDFTLGRGEERRKHKAEMQGKLDVLCALCAANGVKAEAFLTAGMPIDSIRDWVNRQPPDLLIMGTHGRRGISHLLSGSVAEAMLRFAPCPILTVRTAVFGGDHERIMPAGEGQLAR
jgi:nucleotide-binding universal stress UspA family protein